MRLKTAERLPVQAYHRWENARRARLTDSVNRDALSVSSCCTNREYPRCLTMAALS